MAVIIVQTLAEFLAEAPPPALARLSVTSNGDRQTRLDLQARPAAGDLVWLYDRYSRTAPAEVHAQLLGQAREVVERWLIQQGYQVRSGRWAVPESLKPERGRFEVFYWTEAPPGGWRLTPA